MSDSESLHALLDDGDVEGCVAYFRGMPECERRKHARAALHQFAEESRSVGRSPRVRAAAVAAFSTGTRAELDGAHTWFFTEEATWQALEDRRPAWLQEWAEAAIAAGQQLYHQVREAVERGLVTPPVHDNWIAGAIHRFAAETRGTTLAAVLRAHPDFLERDLWPLFEVEGTSDCNLAGHDKYERPEHGWAAALCELAADGTLPRARLLDVSLAALGRDFMQQRAGWFSRFHERLAPSLEERVERLPRYLHLLGSAVAPTVAFALKAVAEVDEHCPVPAAELLACLPAVMQARAKGTVALALRLLRRSLERADAVEVAGVAAQALLHGAADVQVRALDLLDEAVARHAAVREDARVRAAVAAAAEGIVPSLRPRLTPWLDAPAAAGHEGGPASVSMRKDAVTPIADSREMVLELAGILENRDDPVAIERVLEAVPRFRSAGLDLTALAKRARALIAGLDVSAVAEKARVLFGGDELILGNLASMVIAWHEESLFVPWTERPSEHRGRTVLGLFVRRLADLMAVRHPRAVLLGTPTDTRGFVDPATLVERAKSSTLQSRPDQVLALLRLGPAGRDEARAAAVGIPGEFGAALRHALGAVDEPVGDDAALWIAAARARGGDDARVDARHPGLGPGGARAARCVLDPRSTMSGVFLRREPPMPERVSDLHPTVLFHQGKSSGAWEVNAAGQDESVVRWSATVAPSCTEDYFAVAIERIDPEWRAAQWEVRHFFSPLLYADVALGPNACRLLALGLGAKEPGQWGVAVDCVLAAQADGRLDPAGLGRAMAELLSLGIGRCARWARTLAEVARVSGAARRAVRGVIENALCADPARIPKDIGKLLEVLLELCVQLETGVVDPAARAYVEAVGTGGKTGQIKRGLLALGAG